MAEILHPDENTFNDTIISNSVVLVDFWATWCGPCKMLAPVIEKLSEEFDGKAVIAKVDVDQYQDLAQQFGVQSIPTVVFFKNGVEVDRKIGFQPQAVYSGKLNSLL